MTISPLRARKVSYVNGRIVPLSRWIDMYQPAGVSACDGIPLAFDCFEPDVNGNPTDGLYNQYCALGGSRWFFGATYCNTLYVNDIDNLFDPAQNGTDAPRLEWAWWWQVAGAGTAERCVISIFTVEDFDGDCSGEVFENPYDGVQYDFGNLTSSSDPAVGGYYVADICLADGGGTLTHHLPDDGQGGYIVVMDKDANGNAASMATCAQPMLWGTKADNPSQQTDIQWDDDNPRSRILGDGAECYSYDYSAFPQVCPSILGGMMAFYSNPEGGCTPDETGDVDGSGCVDDADLAGAVFEFGGPESGQFGHTDLNCDGIVDDFDLAIIIFNFGTGC
jgi:hypothetical protein